MITELLAATVAVIAVVVGGQRAIRADRKDAARKRADIRDRVSLIKGLIETLQSVLLAERRGGFDEGAAA